MKSQGNSTSKVSIPSKDQSAKSFGHTSIHQPKGVTSGKK